MNPRARATLRWCELAAEGVLSGESAAQVWTLVEFTAAKPGPKREQLPAEQGKALMYPHVGYM